MVSTSGSSGMSFSLRSLQSQAPDQRAKRVRVALREAAGRSDRPPPDPAAEGVDVGRAPRARLPRQRLGAAHLDRGMPADLGDRRLALLERGVARLGRL